MFSKVAALATICLALSVAAVPTGTEYKCNTGEVTCCNQVEQSQSANGLKMLAIAGVAAQGVTGVVGSTCSPFTGAGIGSGGSCKSQPMCCENNNYHGLIVVGCTPVNVGA